MKTTVVEFDRAKARELYRAYKTHAYYSEPIDWELQRTYQLLAQGRMIIQALESIKQAGLNEQGLPKLAIGRADLKLVYYESHSNDGSGVLMSESERRRGGTNAQRSTRITFPRGTFPISKTIWAAKAALPIIPMHLRPKRGLANYHILWEAEWTPIPVRDPYLLRRIGKGDLWLVVAAWELTSVERAALSTRVSAA